MLGLFGGFLATQTQPRKRRRDMVPASRASFQPAVQFLRPRCGLPGALERGAGNGKHCPASALIKAPCQHYAGASPRDSESHCQDVPGIVLINPETSTITPTVQMRKLRLGGSISFSLCSCSVVELGLPSKPAGLPDFRVWASVPRCLPQRSWGVALGPAAAQPTQQAPCHP